MSTKITEQEIMENYNTEREFVSVEDYLKNDNSYILPFREGITTTQSYDENCFHVSMLIKDPAVKAELVDRTTFTEEELEGQFVAVDAYFFKREGTPETMGINVTVVGEKENMMEQAHLTDAEKIAFYSKVIERVPKSEPYVRRSLEIVKERVEKEKETDLPFDVGR